MKRVVVTGLGVVSPIGCGIPQFLPAIKSGTSGIRYLPELETYHFNCRIGGVPEITDNALTELLEKYQLRESGSTVKYALMAGMEAWMDAGLVVPEPGAGETDPDTGVMIGSGIGSMDIIGETLVPLVKEGKTRRIRSTAVEQLLFSAPGTFLSGILAAGNLCLTNSNACATGTEAIYMGFDHIRRGRAKRMIVGGTEGFSPYYWAVFDALRVTATQFNDQPAKGSRPMSASACGMVPAAGAGILILEELDSAIARKAKIYAEISGGFLNTGGQRHGGTMTIPNPQGVIRCIEGALQDAEIDGGSIDCISGHLSSTMGDVIEIKNWAAALGREGSDFPYVNSLKSMTGHCLGAAGAIETIAAVLELEGQFIHPSLNAEDLHPEIAGIIDREKIPAIVQEKVALEYIAKAGFGFGDVNACLILKRK